MEKSNSCDWSFSKRMNVTGEYLQWLHDKRRETGYTNSEEPMTFLAFLSLNGYLKGEDE